jgi:hypothetical protein
MLDSMEAAGIEPNATLHHFTHPQVGKAHLVPRRVVLHQQSVSVACRTWRTFQAARARCIPYVPVHVNFELQLSVVKRNWSGLNSWCEPRLESTA